MQNGWNPVINVVASARKMQWLKQRMTGCCGETTLMNKILDFVMYENPINIEKLRKSLHHQVRLIAGDF